MSRKRILLSTSSMPPSGIRVSPAEKGGSEVSLTMISTGSFQEGDIVTWAAPRPRWWVRILIWLKICEPPATPRYVVTAVKSGGLDLRSVNPKT